MQPTPSPPDSQFPWQYTDLDDNNFQIQGSTLFYLVVLFALILLLSLVSYYARWLCRCLDTPRTLQQPREERGLDKAAIDALPIVLHDGRGDHQEEIECIICLGALEEGEKVKRLPRCGHRFHGECVDRWLTSRTVCPMCRTGVGRGLGSEGPRGFEVVIR